MEKIKSFFHNIFKSRIIIFAAILIVLFAVLIQRIFVLQIVNGKTYLNNYTLLIEKDKDLPATRGNIYDCNGKLLAYNELAYSITIEDNGTYDSTDARNEELNDTIAKTIQIIEGKGDQIDQEFDILYDEKTDEFSFNNLSGTSLQRFRADIFGYSKTDDLKFNDQLGYNEATATAKQIVSYLSGDTKYNISDEYDTKMAYEICTVRYALSANYYRKYISTTIATDVSDETVAAIEENSSELQGVSVFADTIRKYADSKYFANIIGYTGKISQTEYDSLSKENKEYSLTDVVGKSGMEQVMELQLQGKKGYEKFFVDNLGKVVQTEERKEPTTGNDVYLSIDSDLQKAVYDMLEQEIAGILYTNIENIKEYHGSSSSTASDIKIPIDDVYYALVNNNIIDIETFCDEDATTTEKKLYSAFKSKQKSALRSIKSELNSSNASIYNDLSSEHQVYQSYIVSMLEDEGLIDKESVDTDDSVYKSWKAGTTSLRKFLKRSISKSWVNISYFEDTETDYSDTTEIYNALVSKILSQLKAENGFHKKLYKYMIQDSEISGTSLCLVLFDQNVLNYNKEDITGLKSGTISSYEFLKTKIKRLEITPAQLALDPCSGSCVITNPKTGQLMACVTYPGYDNNKLANGVDADYYASLNQDLSSPLYNHATQEETAPGSTFKPVTATAGLTTGVISTSTIIRDKGQFTSVSNKPKCWIYPSSHGSINVSEAIRDSCNYFFYQVGYDLSKVNGIYSDTTGIKKITKYAEMYGLGDKTGIEIPESSPAIATQYPVMAAIGQSNHNYTTVQLARYVTAVANEGTVYNLTLLSKVTDNDGNTLESYAPTVKNSMDTVSQSTWDAIHSGMKMVVENISSFDSVKVTAAGKTGTAQQSKTRPNHALFVGFAPYDSPTLAIATRITCGYTSANSAALSADIMKYYFKETNTEDLLNGQANNVGGTTIHD